MWRRPKSLLSKGYTSSSSIPFQEDLVQGHLLCASEEFPLGGSNQITVIAGDKTSAEYQHICDRRLFGDMYDRALASLLSSGSLLEEKTPCLIDPESTRSLYKARPSFRKAWSRLSIRSIESINYSVVDLSHPSQGGRSDGIHDAAAVLDTLPYSRVFYHAHPGAIITHRGKKYEIVSMTRPPTFAKENFSYRRSLQLAAYVRPSNVRYFTRPLSKATITVIKQLEAVQLREERKFESPDPSIPIDQSNLTTFAGCGAVSVKHQVRGYKKMSFINFSEISRTELTLPPIEYDTFGLYVCADPNSLRGLLGERFGPGVHALSHALLAVAPMFAVGLTRSDLECDHEFYAPTKVMLFDERAGGSGCVQRLWKSLFQRNNILDAAIDLLKNCSSCRADPRYDGGCPACIHASQCLKFNAHLSRSAAIVICERMLHRIKTTDLYKQNTDMDTEESSVSSGKVQVDTTPRRKARQKAMQKAKELSSARDRQFVVGRPSWPLDGQLNQLEHG
jgi:DEAD/DEAH box helicase domain-containing protein